MSGDGVRFDGDLRFGVEASGAVSVSFADGAFEAGGLRFAARLADGRILSPDPDGVRVEPRADGVRIDVGLGGGALQVETDWTFAGDRAVGRAVVRNPGAAALAVDRVVLGTAPEGLCIDGEPAGWAFYKMGWNVASASGFLRFTEAESSFFMRVPFRWLPRSVRHMMYDEGTSFSSRPGDFRSEWLGAFAGPGGATLVAGFAGSGQHFSQVVASGPDALLRLEALLDGAEIPGGGVHPLEPILFHAAGDADAALQGYAREVAARHGARVNPIRLWCSWYSGFYDRVTEEGFLANARKARESGAPVDYFQLDDGYQRCIGDWLVTNDRFPSGLPAVARKVADLGFKPGIWTAPFALSPKSVAFREHPEWVVRDGKGRPVPAGFIMAKSGPRAYYGLDTTRNDVIAWIEDLYRALRGMGWSLFKVDFLTAASVPGVRFDRTATRAQAYRRGLEAVRRAIGDDAMMLSGIGPVLGNAGLMDIQRLGPDTSFGTPSWRPRVQRWLNDRMMPGLYNNISGSLARSFTDGILWSGDGDALIQQGLPPNEAFALAVAALCCGGTVTLGHDYRKGDFDGAIVAELAGRTGPAHVPGRSSGAIPRQVVADGTVDGRPVRWLALVNLGDAQAAIAPHPSALPEGGRARAQEVPGGGTVELDSTAALLVEPRSARLLRMERPGTNGATA